MIAKLDQILTRHRLTASALEQMADLATNRITKWRGGQGEVGLSDAFRIARSLGIDLRWLADDAVGGEPWMEGLRPDEQTVLTVYRALNLPIDEAVRRLTGAAWAAGGTVVGPAPVVDPTDEEIVAGTAAAVTENPAPPSPASAPPRPRRSKPG